MTWSNTASLSDVSYSTRWRDFLDNHIGGLSAWTVAAHPGGDSNKRIMRYDFTDAHDASAQTYYWWYDGASSWYEDARYTTTPGDLGADTSTAVNVYTSTTSPWKIWTSDVNSGSIIMTAGKRLIFMWLDPAAVFNPTKSSWDGSSDREDPQVFPVVDQYQYVANWGTSGTSTSEIQIIPDVAQGHSSSFYQSSVDLFYDTYCLVAKDAIVHSFFKISQSDTLCHVPGNGKGTSGSNSIFSSTNVLLFDGTNYYLRTSSNLSHAAYMFNMGTTEPTF